MKARKLQLREYPMTEEVYNPTAKSYETVSRGLFNYREVVNTILLSPGKDGASTEEIIRSVGLYGKVKDAVRNGEDSILLDNDDYQFLLNKINVFKWGAIHEEVVSFVNYVRRLPEVELTEATELVSPSAAPIKRAKG